MFYFWISVLIFTYQIVKDEPCEIDWNLYWKLQSLIGNICLTLSIFYGSKKNFLSENGKSVEKNMVYKIPYVLYLQL